MKLNIDELKKRKVGIENEILVLNEDMIKLEAEYQFFSSEERIRALASNQLGMVFNPIALDNIKVSESEVNRLKENLENYEYQ